MGFKLKIIAVPLELRKNPTMKSKNGLISFSKRIHLILKDYTLLVPKTRDFCAILEIDIHTKGGNIMARPRKLISAQDNSHRTKEERLQMEKQEEELYNYKPISLDVVPQGITKEGWTYYETLVPQMSQLPISQLDAGMLVIYCNTYAIYADAVQEVSQYGYLDENGKPSGAFKVMNESAKQLKSIAGSLGLSIDSRMKLVIPQVKEKEEDDPFAKMLQKRM